MKRREAPRRKRRTRGVDDEEEGRESLH